MQKWKKNNLPLLWLTVTIYNGFPVSLSFKKTKLGNRPIDMVLTSLRGGLPTCFEGSLFLNNTNCRIETDHGQCVRGPSDLLNGHYTFKKYPQKPLNWNLPHFTFYWWVIVHPLKVIALVRHISMPQGRFLPSLKNWRFLFFIMGAMRRFGQLWIANANLQLNIAVFFALIVFFVSLSNVISLHWQQYIVAMLLSVIDSTNLSCCCFS